MTGFSGGDARSARRAALGFQGGGSLPVRVAEPQLDELRGALRGQGKGWYELEAADGVVLVDLEQIVYLRVESDEHRVGF